MNYHRNEDTICAPATIAGTGAICIIRMSGSNALSIADKIITFSHGTITGSAGYTMKFGTVMKDGAILDEVVACIYRMPHSYTGEDSVEISCHASSYIVQSIIQLLVEHGCRIALPGEFTQRAFLAGKMDLAQAEAVADLISSTDAASHRIALNQLKGGFSKELAQMKDKLLEIVALMELELDFSEEEVEFADRHQLKKLLDNLLFHISKLISSFKYGNAIKNGIPVAIIGAPNSGKSTLLNALLGEERAIVTDIPGTTRDTIEETFNIGGITFRLIDTAGIRDTTETIEKIGIERTIEQVFKASVVLGVVDSTSPHAAADLEKILLTVPSGDDSAELIVVLNKIDLGERQAINTVNVTSIDISAKTGKGLDKLQEALTDIGREILEGSGEGTMITNLRHLEALTSAHGCLTRVRSGLDTALPTDLLTQDIREAISDLASIVGEISSQDVLGLVFSRFCIGK